jgi:hypothetical protein
VRRRKPIRWFLVISAALILTLALAQPNCPRQGLALFPEARQLARLKNRTDPPQQLDFDESFTLAAMLEPGDDRARWSQSRAGVIEGYVLEVQAGGMESANCYCPSRRDIHIHIALYPEATLQERVVVEVTPRMRDWAERQGMDWSEPALKRDLAGRWCRFEGWLLFDLQHAAESERTAPGRAGNWRATAWEIHPVTLIRVLK